MNTGERIKNRRKAMNITAEELGAKVGIDRSTVYRYEKGDIEKVPISALEPFATALHTTVSYLMGWTDDPEEHDICGRSKDNYGLMPVKLKRFPLLGEIACGKPIFAQEDRESYVESGTDIQADFCLKAKGDSMINARIHDGDIVFIKRQDTVNNGEIAAVIIDDEATLKRVYYYSDKGKLVLNPENSNYEPLVYAGEELDQIRIIGKAIAFQSDVK